MILAATGHRPDKLGGYAQIAALPVVATALEYLLERRPTCIISGMALGWDIAVVKAAIAANIPFLAAVPFEGHHKVWPIEAQIDYEGLLKKAEKVHVVALSRPKHFAEVAQALDARNKYMVDECDEIVALWSGSKGGTCNCMAYAAHRGKPCVNVWDRYLRLRGKSA